MRLVASAIALGSLVSATAFAQPAPVVPAPAAPPAEMAPPPVMQPPVEAMPVVAMPVGAPMTPPAPDKAPGAAAAPWYNMVTFDGNADSFYMLNFITDGPAGTMTGPQGRAFDTQANSFNLNYARLGTSVKMDNVSGRIDIGYGHTGAIINNGSRLASGGTPIMATPADLLYAGSGFIVQQAYASLTLGQFTVDFGKFVTTAGAEVIETHKNWLLSRSLLFNAIPFLHQGVRANFKANDMITVQGSIVNGWNNDPDNNGDKTFGLSVNVVPNQMLNVTATGYFGKEGAQGTPGDPTKILADLVVGLTLSDKLGLNLNVDYIKWGDPYLVGLAAMARFVAHEHAVLAFRGEFVKEHLGLYTGMGTAFENVNLFEGTLMLGVPFAGHYELRTELRGDFASQDVFFDGMSAQGKQITGTVGGLFYF